MQSISTIGLDIAKSVLMLCLRESLQMMRRPRSRGKGGWRDQLCGRIGDAGCDDLAVEVEHALHD